MIGTATSRKTLLAPPKAGNSLTPGSWLEGRRGRQVLLAILFLNILSACLFIKLVNRPVYDDQYNISDVHTYATKGVSIASVRSNKNPPGPTGFAWMAATVRIIGGNELRDARIGALLSWILLGAGILVGARFTEFPQLWYGAFLATLLFPHSVESAALVLTEGPALLFAVSGSVLWVEFVSRPNLARRDLLLGLTGGLALGLAVTCRQYFLALLPAALLLAICKASGRRLKENWHWYASVLLSLAAAALPVLLLVLVWGGLSSPGMATGASYHNWTANIGLAFGRPLIAALYTAVYLLPLTAPAAFRFKLAWRWRLISALCGGTVAGFFGNSILQPGPLHTAIRFIAHGTLTRSIAIAVIAAAAIYSASAAVVLLWRNREAVLKRPPVLFAVLAVLFFVAEQVGVGGNIPFYDRYLLQIAPFLGLIAFAVFPRMTGARVGILAALVLVSQIMLWRFA